MELYNQSFSSDGIYTEVPLFATYLGMVTILTATIVVVTPAVIIINVIRWTRELHTKYFFFVANLLGTIAIRVIYKTIQQYLIMVLYLLELNLEFGIVLKLLILSPALLFYLMDVILPITLATERMIVIVFPFRHRSIMTTKTVAGMLAAMWGLSAILTIIITVTVPVDVLWPLGVVYWHTPIFPYFLTLRLMSAMSIITVNILLQYKITISNRKAKENQRLGNEEKRSKKLVQVFQERAKATTMLFLVGGIDVIANILLPVTYVVLGRSVDPDKHIYLLQFLMHPIETGVLLSQILVYGLYMKKIRKRLPKCTTCHGQWTIRHNRVGVLHQQQ